MTLAICCYDGGKVKKIAQHSLWIPGFEMQICEDLHFIFGCTVMKSLCGIGYGSDRRWNPAF